MGDTKGTGAHTVVTHGTPTLFPHDAHINPVRTPAKHTSLLLAGTHPNLFHVVSEFVVFFYHMNSQIIHHTNHVHRMHMIATHAQFVFIFIF